MQARTRCLETRFRQVCQTDCSSCIERASVGTQKTSLLELVRAGGNWARHRHEWQAKHFRWDDNHKNWSVAILSRCQVYHLDENVFTQIADKMPWSTWVEAEEEWVRVAYRLSSFAFAKPSLIKEDESGYWSASINRKKRSSKKP